MHRALNAPLKILEIFASKNDGLVIQQNCSKFLNKIEKSKILDTSSIGYKNLKIQTILVIMVVGDCISNIVVDLKRFFDFKTS